MSAPEQRNAEMVHKKGSESLQSTPLNAAPVDPMLWLFFTKRVGQRMFLSRAKSTHPVGP